MYVSLGETVALLKSIFITCSDLFIFSFNALKKILYIFLYVFLKYFYGIEKYIA